MLTIAAPCDDRQHRRVALVRETEQGDPMDDGTNSRRTSHDSARVSTPARGRARRSWFNGAALTFTVGLALVLACTPEHDDEHEPRGAEARSALATSLVATMDTELDEDRPYSNAGSAATMGVPGKKTRAIVAFDPAAVSRLSSDNARVEVTIVGAASNNWEPRAAPLGSSGSPTTGRSSARRCAAPMT